MDPTGALIGALLGALGALACVYATHRLTGWTTRQENRQKTYAKLRALRYRLAQANAAHCLVQIAALAYNKLWALDEYREGSPKRGATELMHQEQLMTLREVRDYYGDLLDTIGALQSLFPDDQEIRVRARECLSLNIVAVDTRPDDATAPEKVWQWAERVRDGVKEGVENQVTKPLTAFADLIEKAMSRPRVGEWLRLVPALAAAVMLVVAMGRPGSDYYFLLSWIVTASAAYVAIQAATSRWPLVPLVFILIGVLFNPVVEPGLSSDTWDTLAILSIIAFAAVALFDGGKLALAWRRYRRAKAPAGAKKPAEPQPKKAD